MEPLLVLLCVLSLIASTVASTISIVTYMAQHKHQSAPQVEAAIIDQAFREPTAQELETFFDAPLPKTTEEAKVLLAAQDKAFDDAFEGGPAYSGIDEEFSI